MSSENKGKLPDQTVFHVIKIAGREKGIWNKIGVTYKHKDGDDNKPKQSSNDFG